MAKWMRKVILTYAKGVVFQTQDAKKYFDKKIQKKSRVIHNPVYLRSEEYPVLNTFDNRIVSVGRLTPQKNFQLLIDMFWKISSDYPKLKLEIYGEGPLKDELNEYIYVLGLQDKVKLMGVFSDVLDRIYGARLFVMTSLYEGMPNALMEAMCLGIPVVCSNCPCGGPGELIQHGENGFLFENNNIGDLERVVRSVLETKEIFNISKCEKEICETHSENQIFKSWLDYINDIVGSRY